MKRFFSAIALTLLCASILPPSVQAADLLIPGGQIIGLELQDDTVTVAAFDDSCGGAAQAAGLQVGDELLTIDGVQIDCAEDVRTVLKSCGAQVAVTIRRDGKTQDLCLTPQTGTEGPRLGIYLRQGIAGIGTVTYFDPDTHRFGSLGHGVNSARGGLAQMTQGSAYSARILSIKKGKCGQPGQLKGSAEASGILGSLYRNTPQGVFGTAKADFPGQPLPVADYEDVRLGPAAIRCTVRNDQVQEYSVEILKIYPETRSDNRNFLIKVTDPDLLAATSGIVQGMGVIDNMDNTKSQ